MQYEDYRLDQPRHLTRISDEVYRATCSTLSPYAKIPGWRLENCLHDILHVVFLGVAKDLIPSILAEWLEKRMLGPGDVNTCLRRFSLEMHQVFRREKIHS